MWVKEDFTLCIIGNDVVSFFPNMASKTTGEGVGEELSHSTINVDGFNYKLRTKYIEMNEEYTDSLEELQGLLPPQIYKTWHQTYHEE